MEKQKYFTSGDFAKLSGINKRTLHYYNDIGLFRPAVIGENGYHYYSVLQFDRLKLILTLRRVGLSVEEIRDYLSGPSDESFSAMAEKREKLIDASIRQLLGIQAFLKQKADRIQTGKHAVHGEIRLCTLGERKIILSSPIRESSKNENVSVAADFLHRLNRMPEIYDSLGSRIAVSRLENREFWKYDAYFACCPENAAVYDEILPAGTYIQTFCIGKKDKLSQVYDKVFDYADKNHIRLSGYAYEEDFNEMMLNNADDYVTGITIAAEADNIF